METLFFLALFLAIGSALAGIYYLRQPMATAQDRVVLVALRIALFLSLIVALLEPSLKFERLAARRNVVPVLVDASKSMRLFHPDSTVLPFLRSLKALEKENSATGVTFSLYCFGDSLRPCTTVDSIRFSDRQSVLPSSVPENQDRLSPICVIVSDAHFSNASLPKGLFQDMTCLYYSLGPASPRQFISAELLSVNDHVELDSASVAMVIVHGYALTGSAIQLTCKEKSSVVARKILHADAGFFSDTASLVLPTARLGRFLYAVTVASTQDTLRRVLYFTQTVVSGKFFARIVSGAPSLDRRFISLALQNDPQWCMESSAAKECDALFIIDFSGTIPDAVNALARNGVVVFIGSTACQGRTSLSPGSFPLVSFQPDDSVFRPLDGIDLPPPSHLFKCSIPAVSRQHALLGCLVPRENAAAAGVRDTIPFLSVGTYNRKDAVVIAAQDLWRMDFWPLSVEGSRGPASFLQCLIAFIKQRILRNSARNFFVYPSGSEVRENDSISFTVMLPSDLAENFQEEHGASESGGWSVGFTIDSLARTVYRTAAAPIDFMESTRGTVTLPSLPSGSYRYRCTLEYRGRKLEYSDSLVVDPNQEELSVPGQNTVLLDQLGIPLKPNSGKAVVEAFAGTSSSKRATIIDTLDLRKSWILLSVIVVLLAIEWLIRRKSGLE